MLEALLFVILGLGSGVLSGLVGIGGGTVIVPILVFCFGKTQQMAQGTTLALMVPPIGLLAAWQYWKNGFVDLKIAGLICAGFVLGGLVGAKIATHLSNQVLERIFGTLLLGIGLKMIFFPK
ncbi:MAG TPA: sulfite exporter TauE/SafE family protein [Planktothrix sp.]|jgi:hypothetical protein